MSFELVLVLITRVEFLPHINSSAVSIIFTTESSLCVGIPTLGLIGFFYFWDFGMLSGVGGDGVR